MTDVNDSADNKVRQEQGRQGTRECDYQASRQQNQLGEELPTTPVEKEFDLGLTLDDEGKALLEQMASISMSGSSQIMLWKPVFSAHPFWMKVSRMIVSRAAALWKMLRMTGTKLTFTKTLMKKPTSKLLNLSSAPA